MEEERERKKLERKLREKEIAYRARLKLWEEREDKKRRQYEVEKNNEMQRCKLILKDAKKLKQFMEDYDDDKDDSTYYKGKSTYYRGKMKNDSTLFGGKVLKSPYSNPKLTDTLDLFIEYDFEFKL